MNRLTLLLLAIVLSGCVLQRPESGIAGPQTRTEWNARRDSLAQIERWDARGRIAVRSESGGEQGNMRWRQSPDMSQIQLSGPFGAGAFEIRFEAERVTVTDKNGTIKQSFSGPDAAEQFLEQQLGWSFPASSVRYWMLGLLDPGHDGKEVFDQAGSLVGLHQNGWVLSYDSFALYQDYWIPRKFVMETDTARVRVIIDDWTRY